MQNIANPIKALLETELGRDASAGQRKNLAAAISLCVNSHTYTSTEEKIESIFWKIRETENSIHNILIPLVPDFDDLPLVVSIYERKGFAPIYINLGPNDNDRSMIEAFEKQSGLSVIHPDYGVCKYLPELSECFDEQPELANKKFVFVVFVQDDVSIEKEGIYGIVNDVRATLQSSVKRNIRFIFCCEDLNKDRYIRSSLFDEIWRQGTKIHYPKELIERIESE